MTINRLIVLWEWDCLDQGLLDARRALVIPHVHAWVVGLRQTCPQMLYAQRGINYIKNQKTLKQMKTDVWRNKKKRIHLIKTCRPGQVWTGWYRYQIQILLFNRVRRRMRQVGEGWYTCMHEF